MPYGSFADRSYDASMDRYSPLASRSIMPPRQGGMALPPLNMPRAQSYAGQQQDPMMDAAGGALMGLQASEALGLTGAGGAAGGAGLFPVGTVLPAAGTAATGAGLFPAAAGGAAGAGLSGAGAAGAGLAGAGAAGAGAAGAGAGAAGAGAAAAAAMPWAIPIIAGGALLASQSGK